MSSVKDLLNTNVSSFKAPPRFPAGNYIAVITSYEMLPFSWKNSGVHGLSYVPKIQMVSSVEADDDSVPELQEEQQLALDKYGDWTNKEFEFAYTAKETQKRMAQVGPVNFPILETDEEHNDVIGILEKHAWRFYMDEDGVKSGFITDILGIEPTDDAQLGDLMEETVGKKFMLQFDYVPNQDASRPPNLEISSVTCC